VDIHVLFFCYLGLIVFCILCFHL